MVTSNLYDRLCSDSNGRLQKGGSLRPGFDLTMQLFNDKKDFLVKVFANLIVQLGITYFIMEKFPVNGASSSDQKDSESTNWYQVVPLAIIQIIIILTMAFVPMPMMVKLLLFVVFSSIWGVLLSSIRTIVDPTIIKTAIIGVVGIFAAMFLTGVFLLVSGIQLGLGFGFILFCALIAMLIALIMSNLLDKYNTHVKSFSVIGIVIFSLYILYDTNIILQKNYYGDFVTASMDYYLDVINLFLDLINFNN
jgi:FtsH-binding integral membrane protein